MHQRIPQLILKNNLYGIEIDERAGELAAFALFMKAREKYRRFFKKNVQPKICVLENVDFEAHEVKSYLDAVNPDLFTMELSTLLYQFKEADNFGSLIRPEITNIPDVLRLMDEKKVSDDIFLQGIHKRVLKVLNQAQYLCPKYHVVIANPPYMGGRGMNNRLGKWAKDNYPESKVDLFTMFVERNLEMVKKKGMVAMITMQNWMFLSSFEKFRTRLLDQDTILSMAHIGARGFDSIGGEVVSTTAFILQNSYYPNYKGSYLRLIDGKSEAEKKTSIIEAVRNSNCGCLFNISTTDFKKIPGSPIAYWVTKSEKNSFRGKYIIDELETKSGLLSGKDDLFLRNWFEVSRKDIPFDLIDSIEIHKSNPKWLPVTGGGPFRKWYGNLNNIVNSFKGC